MLNYLGPNIGNGPVTSQLPPAMPGTMPASIPQIPPSPSPLPPENFHAVHGRAPAPPHALAAIMRHAVHTATAPQPAPPEYGTTTQEDGSILLHIKNHDGSLGPVVKVLPPIKPRGESSGA